MSGTSSGPLPKNMRLLDGIPVPVVIEEHEDAQVQTVKLAAAEGVHAGRTLLMLTNGIKLGGCVDCDFTHSHWSAVAGHRERTHGAPHASRRSTRRRQLAGSTQQLDFGTPPEEDRPLGNARSGDVDADVRVDRIDDFHSGGDRDPGLGLGMLVPTAADVLPPATSAGKVIQVPSGDRILSMQLGEVFSLAGQIIDAGAATERLVKDRDSWKEEALASRRKIRKLETLIGKINGLMRPDTDKEED